MSAIGPFIDHSNLFPGIPDKGAVVHAIPPKLIRVDVMKVPSGWNPLDSSTWTKLSGFRGAQAITIAPGSLIPAMDCYPDGKVQPDNRFRITSDRPFAAREGGFEFDDIVFAPVSPICALNMVNNTRVPYGTGARTMAQVIHGQVEAHYNRDLISLHAGPRAPYAWHWYFAATAAVEYQVRVPCYGRRLVQLSVLLAGDDGTGTVKFAGTSDYATPTTASSSDGPYTTPITVDAGGQVQEQFSGAPYSSILIDFTPGALNVNAAIEVTMYDED